MRVETENAYAVLIYVAGDAHDARRCCAQWCYENLNCVTVTEIEFIYTGGAESGVVVGLVNYPRFPENPEVIFEQACQLAEHLIEALHQHSALVQDSQQSVWMTKRMQGEADEESGDDHE